VGADRVGCVGGECAGEEYERGRGVRAKILEVLSEKKHGMTLQSLAVSCGFDPNQWTPLGPILEQMEQEKLLILHRSSGGAGVPRGEITLVCLRPEGY